MKRLNFELICPHALIIPWGRDDEVAQCKLDDGPCDISREGCCPKYEGKEETGIMEGQKMDWNKAKDWLYLMRDEYSAIPTGTFALALTIKPLVLRFESGKRTQELYDEIMSIG